MDPGLLDEALLGRCEPRGTPAEGGDPVDLYGQCADYDALAAVCERYGVPLVEDAAEALGATLRRPPRRQARRRRRLLVQRQQDHHHQRRRDAGQPTTELVERARYLATQARDPAPHYEHSELGYNYRMSNLLAAVGRGQLEVLEDRGGAPSRDLRTYARPWSGSAGDARFMPEAACGRANALADLRLVDPAAFGADRETVRLALDAADIEARPLWKPMHLQPVYSAVAILGGEVAEALFRDGLCLPSGSGLTAADQERVIAGIRTVPRQNRDSPPLTPEAQLAASATPLSDPPRYWAWSPPRSNHGST